MQPEIVTVAPPRNRLAWFARALNSKPGAIWIACVLAALFSIYRIWTFTPQPLDGPHTLRPILNNWLSGFLRTYEKPEAAYEDWRAFCLLALLLPFALATLNFARENGLCRLRPRMASLLCSRKLLFAAIAVALLLCRFPTLVDYQLNPDEGQFLVTANKLFYDASYFHAADSGTSGPLNIYPLMLPAIFGISPDFASGRIIVLIIAFCSIYLIYHTVRLLAADSIARIAILPLVGAVAVFEHTNLVHYSSEQIPFLLISVALYTATRVLRNPASHLGPLLLLGLLTSAAFFSKMQSVPIVFAIGLVTIAYVHATHHARRVWRPTLLFTAGMLSLQLLNAAVCLSDGVWTNYWISYIVSNRYYADVGTNFITELPLFLHYITETPEVGYFLISSLAITVVFIFRNQQRLPDQSRLLLFAAVSAAVAAFAMAVIFHPDAWAIAAYVALIAIIAVPMYFLLFYQRSGFGTDPLRWFGLLSSISIAAALFSVYRPHRTFPHYLFLLFPPLAIALAWMLMRADVESETADRGNARLAFPLIFVVLALAHPLYSWGSRDAHHFRTVVATIRAPEGDFIRSLTSPQGRIFVWGWTADPYLSSARVSPTRDYNLFYVLQPFDIAPYYRARLLQDLSQNPVELFIDAVGPVSWAYEDRSRFGYQQFPEIAQFVNDFYVHVVDAYGQRFFIRRDLANRVASVKLPKTCASGAVRCVEMPRRFYGEGATTLLMDDLPPLQMPAHALIEADFTPMGRQTENATIFNNEAVPNSFRGFRFQNIGGDQYRLLVGLGDRWAQSKPILLPPAKPVSLTIDFTGNDVHIRTNGAEADNLHLDAPMADSPGPINVGSWIAGQCRFTGTIDFFQIVAPTP